MARVTKYKIRRDMVRWCELCGRSGGSLLIPCKECDGTGRAEIRCSQCWNWKKPGEFIGAKGQISKRCHLCRGRYKDRAPSGSRSHIPDGTSLRVSFVTESGNRKTGPIPVSMTSASTCPKSCEFYNAGCYAEQHLVSMHWRRLGNGAGMDWDAFCNNVATLPLGQIWRHNEAGDLPGTDEEIDVEKLKHLVFANMGKRGFTYTHKRSNFEILRWAVERGFIVNLSANSPEDADGLAKEGLPLTVVLPHDAPSKGNKTPGGIPITVCPAELSEKVTCERCKICAMPDRKSAVGFRAHGDRKKQITSRQRQLPLYGADYGNAG